EALSQDRAAAALTDGFLAWDGGARPWRRRRRSGQWRPGGDVLDDGRARRPQLQLLEGQDVEPTRDRCFRLSGAHQELPAGRTPEALVALRKGLITQQATGGHRRKDIAEDRPVEVIGYHHQVETNSLERPGVHTLEVGLNFGQAWRVRLLVRVAVDGGHLKAP